MPKKKNDYKVKPQVEVVDEKIETSEMPEIKEELVVVENNDVVTEEVIEVPKKEAIQELKKELKHYTVYSRNGDRIIVGKDADGNFKMLFGDFSKVKIGDEIDY